ncbi:MAG: ATP-binding cassette domain-containing protein [Alphaproteobacteria bacterium]|nr:ATP-binding cassette domain-containing protein [Alphaproteobacteria bacterium]
MLSITDITYSIGGRTILEDCSLNLMDNWKVGVVGVNGAGKSTLFKLVTGDLKADGGAILVSKGQSIGIVRQDIPDTDTPLIDMVLQAHEELWSLMKAAETEEDPYKISDIYMRLGELDAYTAPARAAILLQGLGFKEEQLQEPFSSFSGGWRMRVALAAALFVEPDVLLLDEPTNHLDLEAIMWLEDYLAAYPHTLLIISHDRELLNKCVDHVVHVDKKQMTLYTGNYDTFERERAAKLGLQQKMHEKQMAARAHMQEFINRFKAKASKARQAQSRMKALERMDIVDAVIADRAVRFSFPEPEELSPPLIAIRSVDVGYTAGKPILRRIHENIDTDDRIALLGANGNGKSTLIKLIAGKLAPMAGDVVRSGKLRIGYFSQHQTEELDVYETPFQTMTRLVKQKTGEAKESVVRARLGQFGFSKTLADNRIGSLSGGEKARLLFAFMSFDSPHLLLLDEPTNHLDVDAREALVQALNDYKGAVVIVSHDPSMVERVADRLWLVADGGVQPFDGDLQDYRKYTVEAKRNARREEKKARDKAAANESAANADDAEKTKSPSTLKREIENAEKEIMRLTNEKDILEAQMSDPDVFSQPGKIKAAQDSYNQIVKDLETLETQWLEAQAAYEQVKTGS